MCSLRNPIMANYRLRGSLTVALYPKPADRVVAAGILEQSGNLGCILGVAGSRHVNIMSSIALKQDRKLIRPAAFSLSLANTPLERSGDRSFGSCS